MEKQFGSEILAQCPKCNGNMFWADSVHNAIRCESCEHLMVGLAAHQHIANADNAEKLDGTWNVQKRMGRPPVAQRKEAVQTMIERDLIQQIDEVARKLDMTRSEMIRQLVKIGLHYQPIESEKALLK